MSLFCFIRFFVIDRTFFFYFLLFRCFVPVFIWCHPGQVTKCFAEIGKIAVSYLQRDPADRKTRMAQIIFRFFNSPGRNISRDTHPCRCFEQF